MCSSSFPCNDGHLSQPLFYYFYADLYCYANVRVTYPISVLLTGTSRSQQSVEVPISIQWFVNVIVPLPQCSVLQHFSNFAKSSIREVKQKLYPSWKCQIQSLFNCTSQNPLQVKSNRQSNHICPKYCTHHLNFHLVLVCAGALKIFVTTWLSPTGGLFLSSNIN